MGALLVQQTRWTRAEQSLAALRSRGLLNAGSLAEADLPSLEVLIRPSGFHRQKAQRLRAVAGWWVRSGGEAELDRLPTAALRSALLTQKGIGAETADAVALYAFNRPVFVVDAYLRRIQQRVDGPAKNWADRNLGDCWLAACTGSAENSRQAHAVIVCHAQAYCRSRPDCSACPLQPDCCYAGSSMLARR